MNVLLIYYDVIIWKCGFLFLQFKKKIYFDYKFWIKDDKEFEMNCLIVLEEYRNIYLVLELLMIYCVYKRKIIMKCQMIYVF